MITGTEPNDYAAERIQAEPRRASLTSDEKRFVRFWAAVWRWWMGGRL